MKAKSLEASNFQRRDHVKIVCSVILRYYGKCLHVRAFKKKPQTCLSLKVIMVLKRSIHPACRRSVRYANVHHKHQETAVPDIQRGQYNHTHALCSTCQKLKNQLTRRYDTVLRQARYRCRWRSALVTIKTFFSPRPASHIVGLGALRSDYHTINHVGKDKDRLYRRIRSSR